MATYIVELYWPDMRQADVLGMLTRVGQAARLGGADGSQVRYLGTTMVPGDEACFLRFEGPSTASVAQVCERAIVAPGRIVETIELDGGA